MNKLVSKGLWAEVARLAKKSRVKMAAVAYVTSDEFIEFGEGDLLIVDASDAAIRSGQTSTQILRQAFRRGAEVYSCPGLHAKVMLLDGVAVVGSANASHSSAHHLIEAAFLTDSPASVSMARTFLQRLCDNADPVDENFIERISSLEVKKSTSWPAHTGRKSSFSVRIDAPRTWLVSVCRIDEERYEAEKPRVQKGEGKAEKRLSKVSSNVGWIRWAGSTSRFVRDARPGDMVIQLWKESRKNKRPDYVMAHAPILLRQKEPNCVRFFIERWADSDNTALTWSQFQKLAVRVELPFRVGPSSTRLLPDDYASSMAELWRQAKK